MHRLVTDSIDGLQGADTEDVTRPDGTVVTLPDGSPRPVLYQDLMTVHQYGPTALVTEPYPVADLDFSTSGGYAVYNWELFFHLPLTVAIHLSDNGRYEEAQRWFHYVFDPTDDSDGPTPQRFWKVRPFRTTDVESVTEILINLATGADPQPLADTTAAIDEWARQPVPPVHRVARYRPSAYMVKTVMAYLDNLIAWGDSLFRQDTGETINEATQLYVLAANLLGPTPATGPAERPAGHPDVPQPARRPRRAEQRRRGIETELPFDLAPAPAPATGTAPRSTVPPSARALYFCVPRNDTLLGYWDTVADRLFKIRNSLTIQGVFRQLPLFEPPIDPALLARAAAAGVDVAAVVSGLNQPLPLVRFRSLVAKAGELCQEVATSAASCCRRWRRRTPKPSRCCAPGRTARCWNSARWSSTRRGRRRSSPARRWRRRWTTRTSGTATTSACSAPTDPPSPRRAGRPRPRPHGQGPASARRSRRSPPRMRRSPRPRAHPTSRRAPAHSRGGGRAAQAAACRELAASASVAEATASLSAASRASRVDAHPWGSVTRVLLRREQHRRIAQRNGRGPPVAAGRGRLPGWPVRRGSRPTTGASRTGRCRATTPPARSTRPSSSCAPRRSARPWRSASYTNHQQQIRNADEIERFLTDDRTGKTTNEAFYLWMKRETRGLYGRCFQLAYDIARKAERALQHELGDPS